MDFRYKAYGSSVPDVADGLRLLLLASIDGGNLTQINPDIKLNREWRQHVCKSRSQLEPKMTVEVDINCVHTFQNIRINSDLQVANPFSIRKSESINTTTLIIYITISIRRISCKLAFFPHFFSIIVYLRQLSSRWLSLVISGRTQFSAVLSNGFSLDSFCTLHNRKGHFKYKCYLIFTRNSLIYIYNI